MGALIKRLYDRRFYSASTVGRSVLSSASTEERSVLTASLLFFLRRLKTALVKVLRSAPVKALRKTRACEGRRYVAFVGASNDAKKKAKISEKKEVRPSKLKSEKSELQVKNMRPSTLTLHDYL